MSNQNDTKQLSNCCKAFPQVIAGGEGTFYYECTKCRKACDIYVPEQPTSMNDSKHFDSEGTHSACLEMLEKYQGKVGCCTCNGHDCQPPQDTQEVVNKVVVSEDIQEEKSYSDLHPEIWNTPCPKCGLMCKGEHGVAIHIGQGHRSGDTQELSSDKVKPNIREELSRILVKWSMPTRQAAISEIISLFRGKLYIDDQIAYIDEEDYDMRNKSTKLSSKDKQSDLACEKHFRILIGKNKCVDCESEDKQEGNWEKEFELLLGEYVSWEIEAYETGAIDDNRIFRRNNIKSFIASVVDEAEEKGFKRGFNDCKAMVEKGEHAKCCVIPAKYLKHKE